MSERASTNNGNGRRALRQRPLPPDVTARNLAIEKKRRGALNETILDLARLVPALAPARRLSKVLILTTSVQHFQQQRDVCISAAQDMQELLLENSRLTSEVNALRSQIWGTEVSPTEPKPVTEAMAQLMAVKDEVYGEFPAGFGDNWACSSGGSQSPGTLGNLPEDEDAGPPADGFLQTTEEPYNPQPSANYELAAIPNGTSSMTLAPEPQPHDQWAFDPYLDTQMNPLLSSGSERFAPIDAPLENYAAPHMASYLPVPLGSPSIDAMMRSWAQNIELGYGGTYMHYDASDPVELGSVI